MNKVRQKTADGHLYTSAVSFMPHLKSFTRFNYLVSTGMHYNSIIHPFEVFSIIK